MRILVTGAGGFIGSQVTRALVARGDEVLAVRRRATSLSRIEDLLGRIRIAEAALEDLDRMARILEDFRPQAVIHLAWYSRPRDYLVSSRNLVSAAATSAFVERVFESGCPKLVGVGTCLEYAASNRLRRESDPTDPTSLYASCKLSACLVARALARGRGSEVAWARLFHMHGPGEDPERIIPAVAESLRAGRACDLSPGLQVRDHLHVGDVAAALVQLAKPGISGIFNVCSGIPITLRQVLLTVAEIVGRPELLRFGARQYPADEIMFLAGDPSQLRRAGWAPRFTDLRAGLADALSHGLRPKVR